MRIRFLLTVLLFLFVTIILPAPSGLAQEFPDVCRQSENILRNCNFDSGLENWQPFLETGHADISVLQGGGGCHAPLCPAAFIVTNDHFIGGIYQQVSVTTGNNYYANIVWLVFDSLVNDAGINQAVGGGIGRRVGIDPLGGTDSTSSNVVWSEDNWRNDCKICNVEHVTVTAQADTITVFLRLDDTWRLRAAERGHAVPPSKDQFWLDDLGLKQVGGDAVPVQEPVPTDTPVLPEDTPTPVQEAPPNTPEPVKEDTPTPEPQPDDADEPDETGEAATEIAQAETPATESNSPVATPTPEPANTPAPAPPTLTPTRAPSPTRTSKPRPTSTPTVQAQQATATPESSDMPAMLGAAGTTVCIGSVVLLMAAIVLAGLVWMYRLGWNKPEEDSLN